MKHLKDIFCKRCQNPECNKPLRSHNKSGFCSACNSRYVKVGDREIINNNERGLIRKNGE